MSPLRARVEKGRLVLDEPTTLPEGTVVDLVADDEGDDLTEETRISRRRARPSRRSSATGFPTALRRRTPSETVIALGAAAVVNCFGSIYRIQDSR